MSEINRLYDFQAGTTVKSSQVDEEFNQLVAGHNDHDSRILVIETAITNELATEQYVNTQVTEAMLGNPPLGGVTRAMLEPAVQTELTNKADKSYVDAYEVNYVLSDTVILSLPTPRGGSGAGKIIYIPRPGRYRLKAEIINQTGSGGTAFGSLSVGAGTAQFLNNISTSSLTYVAWSYDLPFLPANSIVSISCGTSTPYLGIRNLTLCGSPVTGTTNTFNGVD